MSGINNNMFLFLVIVILSGLLISCTGDYEGDFDSSAADEAYFEYLGEQGQSEYNFERQLELDQQMYESYDQYDQGGYAQENCLIKGNISFNTGEKIYHLPGQTFYDETVISPEYGERWFCTEAEAIAAGWRKAEN